MPVAVPKRCFFDCQATRCSGVGGTTPAAPSLTTRQTLKRRECHAKRSAKDVDSCAHIKLASTVAPQRSSPIGECQRQTQMVSVLFRFSVVSLRTLWFFCLCFKMCFLRSACGFTPHSQHHVRLLADLCPPWTRDVNLY